MPICKNCGESFAGKRADAVFCSEKCQKQEESKRRKVKRAIARQEFLKPRPCKECGTKFTPALRSIKTQVFCSEECRMIEYYKKRKERGREKEHRQYYVTNKDKVHEYNKIRRRKLAYDGNGYKAMQRDGFKCISCGATENLHVHHKDESGQTENPNNSLDNLVTLCLSCHGKIHLTQYTREHGPANTKHLTKEEVQSAIISSQTLDEAAEKLGLTRKTLLLKRKQYGLPMRR